MPAIKRNMIRWIAPLGRIPAVLLLLAGPVFADGKMYSERVNATIPYQRALILFDEGKQTLVVQSQYQIPGSQGKHTLGWVVPVPAVPQIASMNAGYTDDLFWKLDLKSQPVYTRWSIKLFPVAFFALVAAAIIAVIGAFIPKYRTQRRRFRNVGFASAFAAFLLLFIAPMMIRQRKGIVGVEVIKSEKVGIYDTKVIRSDSPEGLIAWLRENSFGFDQGDEAAIQSYIDRKWCFVTAKVDASIDESDRSAVSNKLLAPLILHFATPQPVYPTALTATAGQPTEILLYLLAKGPMKTTSPLTNRFRGAVGDGVINPMFFVEPEEFIDHLPYGNVGYLNKFKATLTPAQMARDIEFLPEPSAQPFREHFHRW